MSWSRRQFIIFAGAATVTTGACARRAAAAESDSWFDNVTRWCQINTSSLDVRNYDVGFWREQWRRTGAQAIMANGVAGFATFPSRNPLIERSSFAPDRDLLGEVTRAAREEGLYVAARMDSGVLNPKLMEAFPNWLVRDAQGKPGRTMCINSPFREKHVYGVYKEVIERYRVDAFTDNGGVTGGPLCHCEFCRIRWAKEVGGPMPSAADLADPLFRRWRRWNTAVVMSAWEATNAYTKQVGGPACVYLGLVRKFSVLNREVATRSDLLMMDCQSRNDSAGFLEHADEGRFMRSMLGWDKPIAVASSMTQHSHGYFRLTSDPPVEATTYMRAGIAGGFNLWWHHPTAYSEDRRSFGIAASTFAWQKRNEYYLTNVIPVATAGIVRSDDNATFFGRDAPDLYQPGMISRITQVPYRGMVRALFASRIPYYPIHIQDFARHSRDLSVMVFPHIGGMSDAECDVVRAYVERGGSILVTGMTSLYDAEGEPRKDFALANVLGVNLVGAAPNRDFFDKANEESYLRLTSSEELRRHEALRGFDGTQLLGYGGAAVELRVAPDRQVLAAFAAAEGARTPTEDSARPCLIVGTYGRGRVAYLPIDLDRRYLDDPNPDQARLLGNLLRWCAGGNIPLEIEGPGYVGGYLYRKGGASILHLLNGSGVDNGEEMTDRTYPVGPLRVRMRAPGSASQVRLLVTDRIAPATRTGDLLSFELPRLDDYEVIVAE